MWNFRQFADTTAVIDENGNKYTYEFLADEGDKLAAQIGGRKLVFCLCANKISSLLGYAAFLNHGIVPLLLNAEIDHDMLSVLIENYKPDYIWKPAENENLGYELIKTPYNNEFPLYEDLSLLLTTSGSTGSPKFVRHSYKNIQANTESIVEYLKLSFAERTITTLPMNYTYGLSIVNSHLWVGASLILTDKGLMNKEFWQAFKTYGATSFGGVPYIYEMLDKLRFYRMDLPTLKTMTQAGGKLSPELHKKFAEYAEKTNRQFIVMYGQTEASPRMGYLPPEKSLEKYGSMGITIPGGEFSLIDVNGTVIKEADVVGELVYKGKNVTLGYAEKGEDLAKGDERNGSLVTGDMAKRDKDGYYYIVGRKKRFLKIFGNRVNLDEAEQLVKSHFECECACAGVDDKMLIYITDYKIALEVRKYISEKTGLYFSAFEVRTISEIPKNDAGKILYSALEG
jgi:acyl-coenzyme A synthetase/AMP-(fatty) acid ligase